MDPYGTYVMALYFKVVVPERYKYDKPPPVQFDTAVAMFRLEDGELRITPKTDYSTAPEAMAAVQPTLDGWEILADLQYSADEFKLKYDRSDYGYRLPPGAGNIVVGPGHLIAEGTMVTATVTVTPPVRRAYPDPPIGFVLTPDARTMHDRVLGSLAGRELLPSSAYFCLTVIESLVPSPKRRAAAARLLAVDIAVLDKLGELSSEHGGPMGRKAAATKPLTQLQTEWLNAVLRKLILRVGQQATGTTPLNQITMADFPSI
jgi:hypothetical protein